ncbi:MAG TPA: M23 family metallopeptidase, partial [Anaerolineaceae bacterium]
FSGGRATAKFYTSAYNSACKQMVINYRLLLWALIVLVLVAGAAAWLAPKVSASLYGTGVHSALRDSRVDAFINDPQEHPDWLLQAGQRCGTAPFQMPATGFAGYLWDDSFRLGHRHQGVDIFGGGQPGDTPIYAAYAGYLTREMDWKSSLIIRLPQDPLQPARQIWTYYTHMAGPDGSSLIDAAFPPGTKEVFVKAGTLLGKMGNFSGVPGSPVGVHLHFSIVRDNGSGRYLNELDIHNTLDPSPYLGLNLNAHKNVDEIPLCPTSTNGGQP